MSIQPPTAPGTSQVRVVLVDDTSDLRDLLRFALEQHEFRVVGEAGDGRTAVDLVAATQPDLVLLDLAMPVMDGFEALPLVLRACPGATVLVLSGFDAASTGSRAVTLGAHGYLEKGTPLRATVARVREHLAARPTRPTQPTQPTLGVVGDTGVVSPARPRTAAVSPAWLDAVPFGVVQVDATTLQVRDANPAARRLLGAVAAGSPLQAQLPELGADRDGPTEGTHEVSRRGVRLGVTLTRADDALVLVVSPLTATLPGQPDQAV